MTATAAAPCSAGAPPRYMPRSVWAPTEPEPEPTVAPSARAKEKARDPPHAPQPDDGLVEYLRILPTPRDMVLPTRWSSTDKSSHIALISPIPFLLHAVYTGQGKKDFDAASLRSDRPVPKQCPLFYYEVSILSRGSAGYIGVGWSTEKVKLDRLPGWDSLSWGWHGDDGNIFTGSTGTLPFGPRFTQGDVVGCGYDQVEGSLFFTKNGLFLGTAFKDVQLPPHSCLYPFLGFRTHKEEAKANFGASPFVFDITQYVRGKADRLWRQIVRRPLLSQVGASAALTSLPAEREKEALEAERKARKMTDYTLGYLVFHAHAAAAHALRHGARVEPDVWKAMLSRYGGVKDPVDTVPLPRLEEDMRSREEIRQLISHGRISDAIDLTRSTYPSVLVESEEVLFALERRKFVELIRKACHYDGDGPVPGPTSQEQDIDVDIDMADGDSDSKAEAKGKGPSPGDPHSPSEADMDEIMVYGQYLQARWVSHPNAEFRQALSDTFALVAYQDPMTSPVAHLLGDAGRRHVAFQLNAAIVGCGEDLLGCMVRSCELLTDIGREASIPSLHLVDMEERCLAGLRLD